MAITEDGANLTTQHRQAQLAIRARALQDFVRLWPTWTGDDESFQRLLAAVLPLVTVYRGLSAALSRTYFDSFRRAEGVAGSAVAVLVPEMPQAEIFGTLHLTGAEMTSRALSAGVAPEKARQAALVRTSGTVTRLVLDAGRTTVTESVASDKHALGWARVTAGQPCAFCVLLASRGPVYKEHTVAFEAHDHCSCAPEPFYKGSAWPGRAREFRELYDRVASGTENPVNELRRALNGAT